MKRASTLICLFLCFSTNLCSEVGLYVSTDTVIYHGSYFDYEKPEPKYIESKSLSGDITWVGDAVFASMDYRIALFYTHNKAVECVADIDLQTSILKDQPVTYLLKGGKNRDHALDLLYGTIKDLDPGYVYILSSSDFHWEKGLGSMERISYVSRPVLCKQKVNRRQEIERLVKLGLVRIIWKL